MDQLRSMRVFVRVVNEGGFAAAARALDMAPTVVTRVMAELEQHLGARLLNRTTRRMALTEIGEAYLERARAVLLAVDEADALAGASATDPRGLLRVLAPPAFAIHQLAKHLPRFRARYPHVMLELSLPGPVETMDENFDVCILMTAQGSLQGDFIARRLATSEYVTCASPAYLDRRGRPRQPADLLQHDVILPANSSIRREVTYYRSQAHTQPGQPASVTLATPPGVLISSYSDMNYAAALAGVGLAGVPTFVAEEALRDGRLEQVLPGWRLSKVQLSAAMATRKHVPARTRAFIDFLVQTFGGEDHDPWLLPATLELTAALPA